MELKNIRTEIDRVDNELLNLFEQRMELAKEKYASNGRDEYLRKNTISPSLADCISKYPVYEQDGRIPADTVAFHDMCFSLRKTKQVWLPGELPSRPSGKVIKLLEHIRCKDYETCIKLKDYLEGPVADKLEREWAQFGDGHLKRFFRTIPLPDFMA